MRQTICAVLLLIGALARSPATADEAGAGRADRLNLEYAIYFGGLHVVDLNVDVDLAATSYDVKTQVRTVGFLHWLTEWRLDAMTEGAIIEGTRLMPARHRVRTEFRGRPRTVAIDFTGGDVADVRIVPPPGEDGSRNEVPRAAMRGALDPTSALLGLTRRLTAGKGCTGRIPVFDGRRRYDVVAVEHGPDEIPATDYGLFNGTALRCDFKVEPIAGYDARNPEAEERRRQLSHGRAWFAAVVEGLPPMPVRIELGGDPVSAMVHLREVQWPGGAAAMSRTEADKD